MKKKTILIVGLIILSIALGITYAWFTWQSSNRTNVTITTGEITVTYNAGPNISGITLIPVSTKEVGVTNGTAVYKEITASSTENTYMNLDMTLEEFPQALSHQSLVWEIYNGNTLLNSGNLGSVSEGDVVSLFSFQPITSTTSTFKLYIWIDGTQPNSNAMMNQDFTFVLNATATDEEPVPASEKIISLAQNTTCQAGDSGVYGTNSYEDNGDTKYHEYRYIGANPNNYVKYNNDMYQIIGAFDKNSYDIEGVTNNDYGDYLLKVIAVNPLTATAWGNRNSTNSSNTYLNYSNDWSGVRSEVKTNANVLLNEFFYNQTNTSATYGTCVNWTYTNYNNNGKHYNCNTIAGYGIKTNYRTNITTTNWYLKGFENNNHTRDDFYECERGLSSDQNCKSASNNYYSTSFSAKIGLMYTSDYAYASGAFDCDAAVQLSNTSLGSQNWLYKGMEWTITPKANVSYASFEIDEHGAINTDSAYYGYIIRPTFYLSNNLKIKQGNGTFDNPYILE